MKVVFDNVGQSYKPEPMIADLTAIPQVGDTVAWPHVSPENQIVRTVVWCITHNEDDEEIEVPYVYIVVGKRRP